MNRFALTTLAVIASVSAASAMTDNAMLTPIAKHEIMSLVPNADLANLTMAQVQALESALTSGNDSKRGARIRAILN